MSSQRQEISKELPTQHTIVQDDSVIMTPMKKDSIAVDFGNDVLPESGA